MSKAKAGFIVDILTGEAGRYETAQAFWVASISDARTLAREIVDGLRDVPKLGAHIIRVQPGALRHE